MSTSTKSRRARRFGDYALLWRTCESRDPAIINGVRRQVLGDVNEIVPIGCSCGRVANEFGVRLSEQPIGVVVRLQGDAEFTAQKYHGRDLPLFDDRNCPVTIAEVRHHDHAEDRVAILGEEFHFLHPDCVFFIKDHVREEPRSNQVSRRMDSFDDSFEHDISAGKYLSLPGWNKFVSPSWGLLLAIGAPFDVHELGWTLVARDAYRCLITVEPVR